MFRKLLLVLVVATVATVASACDRDGFRHMTGPSPVGPAISQAQAGSLVMSGNWSGTFSGTAGTATAAWTMMQNGSQLTGPGTWSDWHGHHGSPAFSGVMMSDDEMRLMWEIPAWGMGGPMMATACSLAIQGNGRIEMGPGGPANVHGTYAGTNSCTGPVSGGTFSLTRSQS